MIEVLKHVLSIGALFGGTGALIWLLARAKYGIDKTSLIECRNAIGKLLDKIDEVKNGTRDYVCRAAMDRELLRIRKEIDRLKTNTNEHRLAVVGIKKDLGFLEKALKDNTKAIHEEITTSQGLYIERLEDLKTMFLSLLKSAKK